MAFWKTDRKTPKQRGDESFKAGRHAEALAAYEDVLREGTRDIALVRRVGDLRARLGRTSEASAAYRKAAEQYAVAGFLIQAVAVYKILQRLDPAAEDVAARLAELYAERGIPGTVPAPAAPEAPRGKAEEPEWLEPEPEPCAPVRIPLFSDLEPGPLAALLQQVGRRTLAVGETLFREGEAGDSIYVVAAGAVSVERGGREIARLGEGEFFGEAAYFDRRPRNASVRAAAEAELLELRRGEVEALAASHPSVEEALRRFHRMRGLDRWLAASPVLAAVEDEIRLELAAIVEPVAAPAGTVIVREGEPDDSLYFIARGRFSVTTMAPDTGRVVELAVLGPGDVFGEVAALGGRGRTAAVTAVEMGQVLRAGGTRLTAFLALFPQVREILDRLRRERAADTVSKLLDRG
jgi:CRP-like cAMP-binding protein